jgi:Flp pilus assembly protein TadG
MLIFATIEAFIAFAGEQLLENAVDTMSRQVRTGQITFGMGRATDKSEAEFRAMFCDEISLMIKCPETEDPNDRSSILMSGSSRRLRRSEIYPPHERREVCRSRPLRFRL